MLGQIKFRVKSWVQHTLRGHGAEIVHRPILKFLNQNRINLVLDVGASVGGYGSELRRLGYKGRIVSFEPLPDAYQSLKSAADGAQPWVAVHCALGREPGETAMNVASNGDSSSLLQMSDRFSQVAPSVRMVNSITVNVKRLDDIYQQYCSPEDRVFLKIDTQGFEKEVLEGACNSLPRIAGLQLELSLAPLYEGQSAIEEIIAYLRYRGFSPVWFIHGFHHPESTELLEVDGLFFRTNEAR